LCSLLDFSSLANSQLHCINPPPQSHMSQTFKKTNAKKTKSTSKTPQSRHGGETRSVIELDFGYHDWDSVEWQRQRRDETGWADHWQDSG